MLINVSPDKKVHVPKEYDTFIEKPDGIRSEDYSKNNIYKTYVLLEINCIMPIIGYRYSNWVCANFEK